MEELHERGRVIRARLTTIGNAIAALICLFVTSALAMERFTAPWWAVAMGLGSLWIAIQLFAQAVATRLERQYGSFLLFTLPPGLTAPTKEDPEYRKNYRSTELI